MELTVATASSVFHVLFLQRAHNYTNLEVSIFHELINWQAPRTTQNDPWRTTEHCNTMGKSCRLLHSPGRGDIPSAGTVGWAEAENVSEISSTAELVKGQSETKKNPTEKKSTEKNRQKSQVISHRYVTLGSFCCEGLKLQMSPSPSHKDMLLNIDR